jgi:flagellar hook-associated protein 3 FlgL
MRIPFTQTYTRTILGIQQHREALDQLTAMASSGRKLQKPADEPSGWRQAMDHAKSLKQMAMFQENLEFAAAWNESSVQVLTGIADLVGKANEIGIGALNLEGSQNLQGLVASLDQSLRSAVQLANSRHGDRYLFGGRSAATPFMLVEEGGEVVDVTYQGDNVTFQVRTGKDTQETVNASGEEVFADGVAPPDGGNLFQRLVALREAVASGDSEAIRDQLNILADGASQLRRQIAAAGSRSARLEMQKSLYADLQLATENRLEALANVDAVAVITQLKERNTTLEAALRVTQYLSNLNLSQLL